MARKLKTNLAVMHLLLRLHLLSVLKDPTVNGWVPYPTSYVETNREFWATEPNGYQILDESLYRWTFPEDETSDEGLGGGLTYAYAPSFCYDMLPWFKEEKNDWMINCQEIMVTFGRGFTTWSANHKNLRFLDMTQECDLTNDKNGRQTVAVQKRCPWYTHQCWIPDGTNSTGSVPYWVEDFMPEVDASERGKPIFLKEESATVEVQQLSATGHMILVNSAGLSFVDEQGNDVSGHDQIWTAVPRCEKAEIWIDADDSSRYSGLAAYVMHNGLSGPNTPPRKTNGQTVQFGYTISAAVMRFNNNICWYIDNTFCYTLFNDLPKSRIEGIQATAFVIWTLAFLGTFWQAFKIIRVQLEHMRETAAASASELKENISGSSSGVDAAKVHANLAKEHVRKGAELLLESLEKISIGESMFNLWWLIFPPIFYWRIFLPCTECFDFEATATHEIGHVLGFNHPNEHPNGNLRALVPNGQGDCLNLMSPEWVGMDSEFDDQCIMFSLTLNRPRACLNEDDIGGLQYLYPVCDQEITEPVCQKQTRTMGWLRLGAFCFGPYIFFCTIILVFTHFLTAKLKRKMNEKNENIKKMMEVMQQGEEARAEFKQMNTNKDGGLSKEEWLAQRKSAGSFTAADTDGDGIVDLEEYEAYKKELLRKKQLEEEEAKAAAALEAKNKGVMGMVRGLGKNKVSPATTETKEETK